MSQLMLNLWASYHLNKMRNGKGNIPFSWSKRLSYQRGSQPKKIPEFTCGAYDWTLSCNCPPTKSPRNPEPNHIHFKFWAACFFYLNKPVTTGPRLRCTSYVYIVNNISYSTKLTIIRGVVATMENNGRFLLRVGVPTFGPWFLFGLTFPNQDP